MPTTAAPPTGDIELTGLHKSFGAVHAVRGVDLTLPRGQTTALLGPNGAGKSTTIDLLLGLNQPDQGTVSLFGMTPEEAIRAGAIGVMLQTGALLRDLTVRELLTMMASLFPNPLGVDEVVDLTGIERIADRRTNKLSGGETQRVRFAVALVSDPELLVLDEPTVAMDVESRHAFWTTMRSFASKGRTVLFATHYLEEADSYADRIVLMASGQIVADGSSNEIKSLVGRREIRATLPGVDAGVIAKLDGVQGVERRGSTVTLACTDSDAALRAFLDEYPGAKDIEVQSAGLEAAFLQLTASPDGQEVRS